MKLNSLRTQHVNIELPQSKKVEFGTYSKKINANPKCMMHGLIYVHDMLPTVNNARTFLPNLKMSVDIGNPCTHLLNGLV